MAEGEKLTSAQLSTLKKLESWLRSAWQQESAHGAMAGHLFGARPEERAMLAQPQQGMVMPNDFSQRQTRAASLGGAP